MISYMHPDQQQLLIYASVFFSAFIVSAVLAHLAISRPRK